MYQNLSRSSQPKHDNLWSRGFFYITETQTDDKTKNKISLLARHFKILIEFKSAFHSRGLFLVCLYVLSVFTCFDQWRSSTTLHPRATQNPLFRTVWLAESCKFLNGKVQCASFCTRIFISVFFIFQSLVWKKKVKKGVQTRVNRVWRRRIHESFFMLFTQQLIWLSIFFALILFLKTHKMNCWPLLTGTVGLIFTAR